MSSYERIINLMNANGPGSSTLDQHCSAMRMDNSYAWTANRLLYALRDAEDDVKRLSADPIVELDALIVQLIEDGAKSWPPPVLVGGQSSKETADEA